jgi:hypothetical protein
MLPHEHVYVRLAPSKIDGIGVFAIRPIPKDTDIFANDEGAVIWVSRSALERSALSQAERSLYRDFGIRRGDQIGCPVNFNALTPGWYLNEPREGEEANVRVEADFSFHADRDIAEGEELTVRYEQFSRN